MANARTVSDYCVMSEHAIEKAQEAMRDGNSSLYSLHLNAAGCFSTLALAVATASKVSGPDVPQKKVVADAGYL